MAGRAGQVAEVGLPQAKAEQAASQDPQEAADAFLSFDAYPGDDDEPADRGPAEPAVKPPDLKDGGKTLGEDGSMAMAAGDAAGAPDSDAGGFSLEQLAGVMAVLAPGPVQEVGNQVGLPPGPASLWFPIGLQSC